MKHKPGDKVKVRDDLVVGELYGHLVFYESMSGLKEKTVTIIKNLNNSFLLEGGNGYFYSDEMFEEPKEEQAQPRYINAAPYQYRGYHLVKHGRAGEFVSMSIADAPTADVVSREEYDSLKSENDKLKAELEKTTKIIAVDFDGTLCDSNYPDLGEPIQPVIDRLLIEQLNGAKIILWTCREGQLLADAVKWCYEHGITFDAINENLPEEVGKWGTMPRKIGADIYIDDKAVNINDWRSYK